MNAVLSWLAAILAVVNSGADRVVCVPGTPVGITAVRDEYWVISCVDPAGVFLLDRFGWTVSEYADDFLEPQGTGLLGCEPLVCDRGANRLYIGMPGVSREVVLSGGPFAVATPDWAGNGEVAAAVTLRDSGQVVLLTSGDKIVLLAELPGARGTVAADIDCDGDGDLLVACCGTGLHLVLNEGGEPLVRRIGVLGAGVKGVTAVDMDDDGDPDAVGIACAEGGVCWWENPCPERSEWLRHDLDPGVSGPKSIASFDGRILVAALFSPSMLYGSREPRKLPGGCSACSWSAGGVFALGHSEGFIMEWSL